MPEYRQNLATKEWVILSTDRSARPRDVERLRPHHTELPEHDTHCPFCKGNESKTETSVYAYPTELDWKVRVVPNKFAAVKADLAVTRSTSGKFLSAKGYGIAEVVIEHTMHNKTIATMTTSEVSLVLRAYRQRQIEISTYDKINLITIFRNHGPRAGTSLVHPHSQIIATPIVPPHVRYPMQQAVLYYDEHGSCVHCDMVAEELRQQERVVIDSESFVAFCPYASRSPYECRIYPKQHIASFFLLDEEQLVELASVLRELMAKLHEHLDDPDYNYIVRSAPVGDDDTRHLHWYMVIIPKVNIPAGFEIGTGIYINTIAPEECARELRDTRTA